MIPNSFFQRFVVYTPNGIVDQKKSTAQFTEAFNEWVKEQSDLKPAILAELKQYKQLGETKLVSFVTHALKLQPNKDNVERIQAALGELERADKIVRKMTESGSKRGRGAGWTLRNEA